MADQSVDALLDQVVADYSDRRARGEDPFTADLLAKVPAEHHAAARRCFAMIDAGLVTTPTSAAPLAPGAMIDGYRIEAAIGRGGMATVYTATEVELRRPVALKILRPGLAAEPRHVERFRREALAVARLQHPHIVGVFAVGEAEGQHYIAMELIDGPSLSEALGRLPADRGWTAEDLAAAAGAPSLAQDVHSYEQALGALLAHVADAVAAAHATGVLHRDLKPSNILIRRDGRAVVADFGLAKEGGDSSLSLTGEPVGTPYYMSPEQVVHAERRVDQRTDVYSLGVTLYEGLTGRRPFNGETVMAVFDAIRRDTPSGVRALVPSRSADAQAVVRRAMARDPEHRYASAADLAGDLRQLATSGPTAARAREGGPLRRFATGFAQFCGGHAVEYRSPRTLLGWPLVHVNAGPRERGVARQRARGWIAVGDVACGGLAIGKTRATGVVALAGALASGIVALGGALSVGAVALAGAAALGLIGLGGGVGAGVVGAGGAGFGYAAFGGFAAGHYALGGGAYGTYTVSGRGADPEAIEFFSERLPWLWSLLPEAARKRFEDGGEPFGFTSFGTTAFQDTDGDGLPDTRIPDFSQPTTQQPSWGHFTAAHDVKVSVLHMPDAPRQATFTFLPIGLANDEAQRAQFSHLLEHMLISSTDPIERRPDGMLINGETTDSALRLETIAEPAAWRAALQRHVKWLSGREFVADTLEREKRAIAGEEQQTVPRGYTHKWAVAAWNQVVNHDQPHAGVHADVADATLQGVVDYAGRHASLDTGVHIFTVGPAKLGEVRAQLKTLADAPEMPRAVPVGVPEPSGDSGREEATWDLDRRHYFEWFRLPDRTTTERAAGQIYALMLSAQLRSDLTLTDAGVVAIATADVTHGARRFMLLSASLPEGVEVAVVSSAFARALQAEGAVGQAPMWSKQLASQSATLLDFDALRNQMQGRPSLEMLEAQAVLQNAYGALRLGVSVDRVSDEYRSVSAEQVVEVRKRGLAPYERRHLVLNPKP